MLQWDMINQLRAKTRCIQCERFVFTLQLGVFHSQCSHFSLHLSQLLHDIV